MRAPVDHATTLSRRIETHAARISIIGQGYVGLPLAVEFARAGFPVTGLDTDPDRVAALASGRSHVPDVRSEDLQALLRAGRYQATTEPAILAESDAVLICVPPPLRKSKDPDITYVTQVELSRSASPLSWSIHDARSGYRDRPCGPRDRGVSRSPRSRRGRYGR